MLEEYPTAWQGHMKLATKIAELVDPKVFVELGVHFGHSFFSFIEGCNDDCIAIAVDTWLGDDQAGKYDNQVFKVFCNEMKKYPEMDIDPWKMYFKDAAEEYEAQELPPIDLLHIDGRHGYEDVREDFGLWEPYLNNYAVVCFHDIHETKPGFGVYLYWAQLKNRSGWYHTENPGSHGLGIMSKSEKIIDKINDIIWK